MVPTQTWTKRRNWKKASEATNLLSSHQSVITFSQLRHNTTPSPQPHHHHAKAGLIYMFCSLSAKAWGYRVLQHLSTHKPIHKTYEKDMYTYLYSIHICPHVISIQKPHSISFYCDLMLETLQTVKPEPFLKLELDMLFLGPPDLQSVPLQLSKGLRSDLPSQGPGISEIEGFWGGEFSDKVMIKSNMS